MADKKTYTGLSKNYATVPAFSITTIDYLDTKPNYFRVQNRGTTELYCSTNNMPTTKHYDFAVAGKKMKMFAEPYNRTRLYIFNPSGTDVEVAVLSFQAEFEPLTLALSEIEVEMPKDFESSMAITSFNASLPTGNNKIGKVEITNGVSAADVTALKENTHATAENTASAKTQSQTIVSLLAQLLSNYDLGDKVNLLSITDKLDYITNQLSLLLSPVQCQTHFFCYEKKDQNGELVLAGSKEAPISHPYTLKMITNDGAGDLLLNMKALTSTSTRQITMKPGESINDLRIEAQYISVSGTNYSFRAITTSGELM